MYPEERQDYRSEELMELLKDKIDIADHWIFTNCCIELLYHINGKSKAIKLSTANDIAKFAYDNFLVDKIKMVGKQVKLYKRRLLPYISDRRGYLFQPVDYVEINRFDTAVTKDELKTFIARYEYDFGEVDDKWGDLFSARGIVREMYPSINTPHTKRTA